MSLLMDIQTNRCWARVDFLATGEIVLHIPEECELPIRVLVSRGGRSTEYEPKSSEKPNNSTIPKMEQVEQRSCDTCKNRDIEGWKNPCLGCIGFVFYEPMDEPQTHEIRTNTHECVKDMHDKDEPQTERSSE